QGGTPSIQVGPDKVSIVSDVDIKGAVVISKTLDVGGNTNIGGVTVSVNTHTHLDAEGRPTGPAVSVRSASLLSRLLGYLRR
ncbi:hypothetical protein HJ072_25335, partial [Vibrio parahaemolyticus]|nr:hypothetical protein [Vibrio parahaemolyticus]